MKTLLLLLFTLLLGVPAYTQRINVDSAWKALETSPRDTNRVILMTELSFEYFYANDGQPIADSLVREIYILSDELDYPLGTSNGHHHKAVLFFIKDANYPQAQKYFHKCLKIRRELNRPVPLMQAYSNLASTFLMQDEYDSALHYYFEAKPIIEMVEDHNKRLEMEGTLMLNFGLIYMWQENYEDAITHYQKGLDINLEQEDMRGVAKAYNYIGLSLSHLGRYEEALVSLDSSMQISQRIDYQSNIYELYSNLGVVHDEAGELEEGLKWHLKSQEIAEQHGDLPGAAVNLSNIAQSLYELGRYRESLEKAEEALALKEHVEKAELMVEIYDGISKAKYAMGDFKGAWEAIQSQTGWKDSVQKKQDAQLINEFETRVKNEEQRREIARLEKERKMEDELKVLRAAEQRNKDLWLYGIIGVVALISLIIGWAFLQKSKNNRQLNEQKNIIESKNKDLKTANTEITAQKEEIEEKNRDIVASINYAKRLQDALLPSADKLVKVLPEVGLLYLPKDIVSGDFYWMQELNGKVLFAVADCTGHGVPGAMVSVVGLNGLNRVVKEFGEENPAEILRKLDSLVADSFAGQDAESTVRDGMDMSLCCYDPAQSTLAYAGANNPLYIIRHKKENDGSLAAVLETNEYVLLEVKANKQPIGHYDKQSDFTRHDVALKPGDAIFLFTDGFADQFGGPKGKKFKYKPFKELLLSIQHQTVDAQMKTVSARFEEWKGEIEQVDDVCILGVRV